MPFLIPENHSKIDMKLSSAATLPKTSLRFKLAFALLCIINLVCAIDATILSVALPTIARKLQGTAIQAFWTGTSFLLTSTVFQPAWASFSHIIGRMPVLMAAVLIFTIGTIVCSLAQNFPGLLLGRCFQGAGGGGIVALTYVIVSDMIPLRERGRWFGVISLQWAIGSAVGPVLGGAFAERDWRWIFWTNLPFCVVGLVGIPVCLRLQKREGEVWQRLKKFDWIGSFFFMAGLTSFLVPLTWGGINYPWSSWRTIIPLCVGVIGIVAFVLHSNFIAKDPLIRGSIFSSFSATVNYICTTIHSIIICSALFYMPLYFEVAKGYTPMKAGIALFPFTLTLGPAAVVVGLIIAATGKYKPSLWMGWFLAALGTGLLPYLNESTSTPAWIFMCLIPGIGYGILYPAMSFAVQAPASNSDLPFAAAMFSFFRSLGQTLGVAIGGVVFQNSLKYKISHDPRLSDYDKAEEWSRDASALVELIRVALPGKNSLKEALTATYTDALQILWVVMATFACVSAVACSFLTEEIGLDRDLVTEQGFKHKEKMHDCEKAGKSEIRRSDANDTLVANCQNPPAVHLRGVAE